MTFLFGINTWVHGLISLDTWLTKSINQVSLTFAKTAIHPSLLNMAEMEQLFKTNTITLKPQQYVNWFTGQRLKEMTCLCDLHYLFKLSIRNKWFPVNRTDQPLSMRPLLITHLLNSNSVPLFLRIWMAPFNLKPREEQVVNNMSRKNLCSTSRHVTEFIITLITPNHRTNRVTKTPMHSLALYPTLIYKELKWQNLGRWPYGSPQATQDQVPAHSATEV